MHMHVPRNRRKTKKKQAEKIRRRSEKLQKCILLNFEKKIKHNLMCGQISTDKDRSRYSFPSSSLLPLSLLPFIFTHIKC